MKSTLNLQSSQVVSEILGSPADASYQQRQGWTRWQQKYCHYFFWIAANKKRGRLSATKQFSVFRRGSECIKEKVISRFLLKSRQRVGSQLRAIRGQNTQLNLNVPSPTSVTLDLHLWLFWYFGKHLCLHKASDWSDWNSFQNHKFK